MVYNSFLLVSCAGLGNDRGLLARSVELPAIQILAANGIEPYSGSVLGHWLLRARPKYLEPPVGMELAAQVETVTLVSSVRLLRILEKDIAKIYLFNLFPDLREQ